MSKAILIMKAPNKLVVIIVCTVILDKMKTMVTVVIIEYGME